jgi:RNA polymerase sigma-70 factor (ECF subfamily)
VRSDAPTQTAADREAGLVGRAARGDREAFAALLQRYQRPVVAFAYRYLGQRDDAEDVAQDAFIRVYFSLAKLRQPERFSTYLFATALNLCRRRAARPRPPLDPPGTTELPESTALRREEREQLLRAVAALPAELRDVVSLRAVEELGFAEIGEIVGASEGACRVRFHRAKEMLKAALEESAGTAREQT